MRGRTKDAPASPAKPKRVKVGLRLRTREAMDEIMEDKEAPAAARVQAARLLHDAGFLDDDDPEAPAADRSTVSELDAEIARLQAGDVGKA